MMGYDGHGKETIVKEGLGDAEKIIHWLELRTAA
jgi:hypothetical protein